MSNGDTTEQAGVLRRRNLLRALGTGGVIAAGIPVGTATGGPGDGNSGNRGGREGGVGQCTCVDECPGETFCGKVDGPPEEGREYTFSSDGESYSVTVESVTLEDGEEKGFTFSSSDSVERVCVKGGPEVVSYELASPDYTGDRLREVTAPENPNSGTEYQISNFSFCGTPDSGATYYQIDLVEGDVICDDNLSADNLYGERLLAVLAVNGETGEITQSNTNPRNDSCGCITLSDGNPITYDESDRTATVDFGEISSDVPAGQTHALAGYEILDDGATRFSEDRENGTIEQQLRACDAVEGAGEDTLSIDLDDGGCDVC